MYVVSILESIVPAIIFSSYKLMPAARLQVATHTRMIPESYAAAIRSRSSLVRPACKVSPGASNVHERVPVLHLMAVSTHTKFESKQRRDANSRWKATPLNTVSSRTGSTSVPKLRRSPSRFNRLSRILVSSSCEGGMTRLTQRASDSHMPRLPAKISTPWPILADSYARDTTALRRGSLNSLCIDLSMHRMGVVLPPVTS